MNILKARQELLYGKNIYDIELLREKGFEHHCIGRNI